MKNKLALLLTVIISWIASVFVFAPVVQSAVPPVPKVGNCYNLTREDVKVDYSDIPPINCLRVHTSETYRVVKLDSSNPAVNFDLKAATAVCMPWKGKAKFLNYWAWYIPNPGQQMAGQNWIRCDAMIIKNYNESTGDYTVTSWRGKRLDIR